MDVVRLRHRTISRMRSRAYGARGRHRAVLPGSSVDSGLRGPLRRKTPIRLFSAVALLDFLTARFSLMDLPDFLLADCRGDLSDMTLPSGALPLPYERNGSTRRCRAFQRCMDGQIHTLSYLRRSRSSR